MDFKNLLFETRIRRLLGGAVCGIFGTLSFGLIYQAVWSSVLIGVLGFLLGVFGDKVTYFFRSISVSKGTRQQGKQLKFRSKRGAVRWCRRRRALVWSAGLLFFWVILALITASIIVSVADDPDPILSILIPPLFGAFIGLIIILWIDELPAKYTYQEDFSEESILQGMQEMSRMHKLNRFLYWLPCVWEDMKFFCRFFLFGCLACTALPVFLAGAVLIVLLKCIGGIIWFFVWAFRQLQESQYGVALASAVLTLAVSLYALAPHIHSATILVSVSMAIGVICAIAAEGAAYVAGHIVDVVWLSNEQRQAVYRFLWQPLLPLKKWKTIWGSNIMRVL